jgi:hypothetical protein
LTINGNDTIKFDGSNNLYIGDAGPSTNGTDNQNTGIGQNSLTSDDFGQGNVAIGHDSQPLTRGTSGTEGSYNTSVGRWSMAKNITGSLNVAIGADALWGNVTGNGNVAIGDHAMLYMSSGNDNIAIGGNSLTGPFSGVSPNETGANTATGCVAVGADALSNTESNFNIGVGSNAGIFNETGQNNIFLGLNSGNGNGVGGSVGNNNMILIGSSTDAQYSSGLAGSIGIGLNVLVPASSCWVIGAAGVKQYIKTGGSSDVAGVATLVAGTATVSTTSVSANSMIFITSSNPGGTPGWLHVSARTNGTSFVITSSSASDTSDVSWEIKEKY